MCFSLKEMVLTFSSFSADIVTVSHTNTRAEGRTQTHSHAHTRAHTHCGRLRTALSSRGLDTLRFLYTRDRAHTNTRRRDGASATLACCCPLPETWLPPSPAQSDVTQVRRLLAGVFRRTKWLDTLNL